ncbi:MAG TPA: hypothetical protein V6C65_33370 [Allocoleopsis sp.]
MSGNQIDRAIESLGLPPELQPEHVDRLKAHFQATARPAARAEKDDRQSHRASTSNPTDRRVGKVSTQAATQTSDGVIDRANSLITYADNMTLAVGQKVDEAAFRIAATIASVPAQLATRTQYYLDQMGGQDAWSQLDRALTAFTAPTPAPQQKAIDTTQYFELPACED